MNEKKKLLVGIGIAFITALLLSWIISLSYSGKKSKKMNSILGTTVTSEYSLDVSERKIAKEYSPLDLSKVKKLMGANEKEKSKEENKVVDIKNEEGRIIGKKEYKGKDVVIITSFDLNDGSVSSVETTKEKNRKYEGETILEYANGTKNFYTYKKGVKQGKAEVHYSNGDKEIYKYVDGVPNGEAVYYYTNGDKEIYEYSNGIEKNRKYIYKDGRVENID